MARLSLRRDERGNSVIELALVLPILSSMLVGMVDLSRGYSTKLQTQQAAQRAIEKVMQTTAGSTVLETLKAEAADGAGVAESAVAVEYWLECNGVKQTGADMDVAYAKVCPPGETYARYLTVDITKIYTPMFAFKFAGASTDGTYTLHGKAGIRTQ